MITTILIVLVAVVVLIVIIAVLALRYLRADDSDTFDDIPDEPRPRRAPEHQPAQLPARSEGRQRQREPVTEAWAADRPVRPGNGRGPQPGHRDRETGARPSAPARAGSQSGGQRRPAAVAPSARAARPDDADSATNSWESLSDVDYWAELAADKPQPASAKSGPAQTARRGPDVPGSGSRQPSALQRRQPARPVGSSAAPGADLPLGVPPGLDAPGRRNGMRPGAAPRPAASQRPAVGPRPALPQRQQLPAAQAPSGNGHARIGGPADDDPLTSPSFPAIDATDSRSYRTRRPAASQPGMSGANRYHNGSDHISGPDGYPVQSPAQALSQPSPGSSGSPAANPYGSYVSPPPAHDGRGYPDAAAASRAPADYGYLSAAQDAGSSSHYPATAADGYLPAAGLGATGPATGRHAHNGSAQRGYGEIDYGSLRYDDSAYPDTETTGLVGYAAPTAPTRQYDQRGYGGPEPDYSQDGYPGYSGYGSDGR